MSTLAGSMDGLKSIIAGCGEVTLALGVEELKGLHPALLAGEIQGCGAW